MRCADHGRQVAAKFTRVANVQRQQIEQVAAKLPRFVQLDRRDAQALLPDFGCGRIVTAMGGAADVALMGTDDGPEQPSFGIENRNKGCQVGQMAAAMIGIVKQYDVAGTEILKALFDGQGCPRQRPDMHRNMIGLGNQAAPCVAYRQREIPAGIEYLRIGGAKHGFAHFLDDRTQPMLND